MTIKVYEGFFDSLYKKWELYLFRLFQLAKWVETSLKYASIQGPEIEEILDERGCDKAKAHIRIPPNPFWIRDDDREIFEWFYDQLFSRSMKEKELRELFKEIWLRISEIKEFVGITRNTQYIGEENSEKRLLNEIDVFIKFPESVSPITKIVLGDPKDVDNLRSFQRFLKDREPVRGVISIQKY